MGGMDLDSFLLSPFKVFHAPNLKLPVPTQLLRPSPYLVFAAVYITYFIFLSGVIYDVITETPPMGGYKDPVTGAIKPQAILPNRINGQYIIEGLSAGFLFCLGGAGFILLDFAASRKHEYNTLMVLVGATLILIAYNICVVFIKIKVGNYLR